MSAPPGHMMLSNGRYWNPLDPDPSAITLEVIALGLSRINRFSGQTTRAITVDEHCLRVRRIAAIPDKSPLGRAEIDLHALLHDAHEPLTAWGDVPSPLKTDNMREVEAGIDVAIKDALGIKWTIGYARTNIVAEADLLALYYEAALWFPPAIDWIVDIPTTGHAAAEVLPLIQPRDDDDWISAVRVAINNLTAAQMEAKR